MMPSTTRYSLPTIFLLFLGTLAFSPITEAQYSGPLCIAVADTGTQRIATTNDGITWSGLSIGGSNTGVAWNTASERWGIKTDGQPGVFRYSDNGATFNTVADPDFVDGSQTAMGLAGHGDTWLAGGNGGGSSVAYARSLDNGLDWSDLTTGGSDSYRGFAYSPSLDLWVSVREGANSGPWYSENGGTTWNTGTLTTGGDAPGNFENVIWTGSYFYAVGMSSFKMKSSDGKVWLDLTATAARNRDVAYDGSRLIGIDGVSGDGLQKIYFNDNDAEGAWSAASPGITSAGALKSIAYSTDLSKWVAVGEGRVFYSDDGQTWTLATMHEASLSWEDVACISELTEQEPPCPVGVSFCKSGFQTPINEIETAFDGARVVVREKRGFEVGQDGLVYSFNNTLALKGTTNPCFDDLEHVQTYTRSLSISLNGVVEASCQRTTPSPNPTKQLFIYTYNPEALFDVDIRESLCLNFATPPCFYTFDASVNLLKTEMVSGNHQVAIYDSNQIWYFNPLQATIRFSDTLPSVPLDVAIDEFTKNVFVTGSFGTRVYGPTGTMLYSSHLHPGKFIDALDSVVYIGTTGALTKYTFSGSALTQVWQDTFSTFPSSGEKGFKLSHDGDYLVHWLNSGIKVINASDSAAVHSFTLDEGSATSAALHVSNSYLFVGTSDNRLLRYDTFNGTTTFGDTGDTEDDPNPTPGDTDGDGVGDGGCQGDFECNSNPDVPQTEGSESDVPLVSNPADAETVDSNGIQDPAKIGLVGDGDDFFGVALQPIATAWGTSVGAFQWLCGIFLISLVSVAMGRAIGALGTLLGAGAGLGWSTAMGFTPIWLVLLLVLIMALSVGKIMFGSSGES